MPCTTVTSQCAGALEVLNVLSIRRAQVVPSKVRSYNTLSRTASENPPQGHIDEVPGDYDPDDPDDSGSDEDGSGNYDGDPHPPPPPGGPPGGHPGGPPGGPPGGNHSGNQPPEFPDLAQAITLLAGNLQQPARNEAKTKI
jgi:hypothetical protein